MNLKVVLQSWCWWHLKPCGRITSLVLVFSTGVIFSPRRHLLVSGDILMSFWLLLVGATGIKR